MFVNKIIGIVGAFVLICGLSCAKTDKKDDELASAVNWLWSQQSEDGGWHSKTHAVLRDGKVLTPYILFHLLQLPDDLLRGKEEEIKSAYAFIVREMNAAMNEDKTSLTDYPNYSAAYALRVMNIARRDTQLQSIIINYLFEQQFTEQRGFDPTHLAYGGWGYGEGNLKSGEYGHVDISHTRRITEALVQSGHMSEDAKDKIRFFLKGVQRDTSDQRCYEGCINRKKLPYDGGFVASVITIATIKSEPQKIEYAGTHYPSYATATCDALMAMRVLGMQETKAYSDALHWLIENQHYNTIDGLADHPGQWDEIMHYYHLAVRSEAMNVVDPYGEWRDSIEHILQNEMQPDGFYVNPMGGVNKEDDPLMATIFAIQALGNIRTHKEVITSTDLKIINCYTDPFFGRLYSTYYVSAVNIVIQNLTTDTLFFAGTDSLQLQVAVSATYPPNGIRHSHIGDYFGKQPHHIALKPLMTDTLIYYHSYSRPYSRMDIQLDYRINQQFKSAWAILYN